MLKKIKTKKDIDYIIIATIFYITIPDASFSFSI